jgi:xylulokinase
LYTSDGSVGAAIGAGIGSKAYQNEDEAFVQMKPLQLVEPKQTDLYESYYQEWKQELQKHLDK